MAVLRAADSGAVYESPYLLMALNFVFSTLVSLFIACLVGRSFLVRGTPGLLMLGCGVAIWGGAGFVGSTAGILGAVNGRDFANITVTIHNGCAWLSALCHLAGATLSLRPRRVTHAVGLSLAAAYTAALSSVGAITLAALSGWLPIFFVQGRGGTPLRHVVLASTIAMFAFTAALILGGKRRSWSPFAYWYALALLLVAAGLSGVMIQPSFGSLLGWTGRAAQYLGGVYMLIAAIVSVRESRVWGIALEAALTEARQQYEELFDLAADGIVVHELAGEAARGNFVQANPSICGLLGYTPREMRALTPLDIMAPEDRQAVPRDAETLTRDGVLRHEKTLQAKDGRRIPAEISTRLFRHRGCTMVMSVIRDITERKQAEEALRRASEQRRMALEAAGLGAWDYRFDTGEVFWDERCRNMSGVPAGTRIAYRDLLACIHDDDRAATGEAVQQAIAGAGGGAFHREFRVVWPDGSVHWVALHGHVYFEGEGDQRRAVRFIGLSMDITERRQAEEGLRQRQKLESIGLLAGGIAHDFNNLLVGVIGNASLAGEMLPGDSPAINVLKSVVQAGEQAAHLTGQLLAYAGKGRFFIEPVDLSRLVRETSALVRSSIAKKIALQLQLESDITRVESDASQMQQVFMNLALNAAEAIGDRAGRILVATGEVDVDERRIRGQLDGWPIEPGRHVLLEVRDDGCGMDPATKARIFDPFFTTKFHGRGLGLAAVAGIVRAHRGAIEVTSAPGAGATFRVLLPAVASGATAGAPPAQRTDDLRGAGTIVFVDDEELVRDVAKHSLERLGYHVLEAPNGPAAIEILRSNGDRIRLVVLDLGMPGMSGEETLPHLRRLRPDLKVIVSSGYSEAEALRLFHGARVSGFIQKPYTFRDLARAVKSALADPEAPGSLSRATGGS